MAQETEGSTEPNNTGSTTGAADESGTTGAAAEAGTAAGSTSASGGASTNADKTNGAEKAAQPEEKTNYSSRKPGIIGLGIYLLGICLFSVVSLATLMMAENPPLTLNKNKQKEICCGGACRTVVDEKNRQIRFPANTPANTTPDNKAPAQIRTSPDTVSPTVEPDGEDDNSDPQDQQSGSNGDGALQRNFPDVTVPPYVCVKTVGLLSADSYVFLIVLFAGTLGGVIRGMWSFFSHLGLGNFSFKWTWYYLFIPFSAATLSLVIYFVIRGGFYGATFGKGLVLNVFSFAALAALTGLFSEHALRKLKQFAITMLGDVPNKVENANEPEKEKP